MKFVLIALTLLLSISSFAAEQELTLQPKADGQPSFGIQYAYESDFAWVFTYATTRSKQSIASLPSKVFWNILDVRQNRLLSTWTEDDKEILITGAIGISDKTVVAALLPNLKNAKVVYGIKNQQGLLEIYFSIPIGPLCQNYASHFTDLTNTSKKACEVKAEDIPDFQAECKEWKAELLEYVKQGLLSCDTAKKQSAKKSCGELICP